MVFKSRFSRLATASVLIVYVNSSVGMALAERLFDAAEVSLAPVAEALDALDGGSRHDIVLLCPYLAGDERDAVLAACDARLPPPAVLEVTDTALPPGAHVRVVRSSPYEVGPVLANLALPVGA